MQNMTSYRDFSQYQTLQNKLNILSPYGMVRSQPILSKPYSTKTSGASRVSILTLDLETRQLSGGHLEVISSCIYDGENYHTFYLIDFKSQEELLIETVKVLVDPMYNGYQVYIHNFSLFDAIFLFKYIIALSKLGFDINFLKREDKFINITICKYEHKPYFNKKGELKSRKVTIFDLTVYDSYLILPNSLSKLATAFNVTGKLSFNVLNNNQADLNDPAFRSELLEYNKQDCKALYDVMVSFNTIFKELFKMSILGSPTLPSIAFKLFKSNFLNENIEIT
jgi:DNA polymerase type B, organellar and viral